MSRQRIFACVVAAAVMLLAACGPSEQTPHLTDAQLHEILDLASNELAKSQAFRIRTSLHDVHQLKDNSTLMAQQGVSVSEINAKINQLENELVWEITEAHYASVDRLRWAVEGQIRQYPRRQCASGDERRLDRIWIVIPAYGWTYALATMYLEVRGRSPVADAKTAHKWVTGRLVNRESYSLFPIHNSQFRNGLHPADPGRLPHPTHNRPAHAHRRRRAQTVHVHRAVVMCRSGQIWYHRHSSGARA